MIKNNVAVVGAGLGGCKVGYGFQQRNYNTYLINGSLQDNRVISGAKNMLVLSGYDGLGGDRNLAYEALKNNKEIIKKIQNIEEKVILFTATGGGTTGSACVPMLADIACQLEDKIVCAVLMMPRLDEPIQKRLNAYNAAKELMEIPEMGAIFFVNNDYCNDLDKINFYLINMLDAFFTDNSASNTSNFDDSEKYNMLSDHGSFYIAITCKLKDDLELFLMIINTSGSLVETKDYNEMDVYELKGFLDDVIHEKNGYYCILTRITDVFGFDLKINNPVRTYINTLDEEDWKLHIGDDFTQFEIPVTDDSVNEIYVKDDGESGSKNIVIKPYNQPFMEISMLFFKKHE